MRALPFLFAAAVATLAIPTLAQVSDAHTSKTPPPGPPWHTEFAAARAAALAANQPIFVYSTKTY